MRAVFLADLGGGFFDDGFLKLEFFGVAHERDHDFGKHLDALFLLHFGGGLEDGGRLHLRDFRIDDSETAAAVAEHGVLFVQLVDAALDDLLG